MSFWHLFNFFLQLMELLITIVKEKNLPNFGRGRNFTDFSTFFENKPLAWQKRTGRWPNVIKKCFLDPRATNGYDENALQCIQRCRWGLEILDITQNRRNFEAFAPSPNAWILTFHVNSHPARVESTKECRGLVKIVFSSHLQSS